MYNKHSHTTAHNDAKPLTSMGYFTYILNYDKRTIVVKSEPRWDSR